MANRKVRYKFSRKTLVRRIREADANFFDALNELESLMVDAHLYRKQFNQVVELFDRRLDTRTSTENALDVELQGLFATSHDIFVAVDKMRHALGALDDTWLDINRPNSAL